MAPEAKARTASHDEGYAKREERHESEESGRKTVSVGSKKLPSPLPAALRHLVSPHAEPPRTLRLRPPRTLRLQPPAAALRKKEFLKSQQFNFNS